MAEKVLAAKFIRSVEQAKKDWLCALIEGEYVPLDVVYKAKLIKIQKEYHPFAIFSVTGEADWTATSIWEHYENYQVAREETVYVDYQGVEHKDPGKDREYRNGRYIDHWRKPKSRPVYDNKRRLVTDGIESTSGYVPSTRFIERIWTANSQSLLNWVGHFNNSDWVSVGTDYFKDYTLIPEAVSPADAKSKAWSLGVTDLTKLASQDVPGNRHENLRIAPEITNISRTTYYLCVYHIFYEYNGKSYECLMTGGTADNDRILGDYPIDESMKAQAERLQSEVRKNSFFSMRLVYLYGLIIYGLILFVLFGSDSESIAATMVSLIFWVYCFIRYFQMRYKKRKAKAEIALLNKDTTLLKTQICDVIRDTRISEFERDQRIEGLLDTYISPSTTKEKHSVFKLSYPKNSKLRHTIKIIEILLIINGVVISYMLSYNDLEDMDKSNQSRTSIVSEDKQRNPFGFVNKEHIEKPTVNDKDLNLVEYREFNFEGLRFELPKDIKLFKDNNGNASFSYPSGSGGVEFNVYDSSESDINADNLETWYDAVIAEKIQDYDPQELQPNLIKFNGCIAKSTMCYIRINDELRPCSTIAVCNEDYSLMYVIQIIVTDQSAYTQEDQNIYEHMVDTITLS